MDKAIDIAANYGLLGLVLGAIGLGMWSVWKWVSVNVIKPMVDAHISSQVKATDSQIKLNEQIAAHAVAEERLMLQFAQIMEKVADTQNQIVNLMKGGAK